MVLGLDSTIIGGVEDFLLYGFIASVSAAFILFMGSLVLSLLFIRYTHGMVAEFNQSGRLRYFALLSALLVLNIFMAYRVMLFLAASAIIFYPEIAALEWLSQVGLTNDFLSAILMP